MMTFLMRSIPRQVLLRLRRVLLPVQDGVRERRLRRAVRLRLRRGLQLPLHAAPGLGRRPGGLRPLAAPAAAALPAALRLAPATRAYLQSTRQYSRIFYPFTRQIRRCWRDECRHALIAAGALGGGRAAGRALLQRRGQRHAAVRQAVRRRARRGLRHGVRAARLRRHLRLQAAHAAHHQRAAEHPEAADHANNGTDDLACRRRGAARQPAPSRGRRRAPGTPCFDVI